MSLGGPPACRGSFLLGDRVMIGRMPRYFFTVTYPDQEIDDTEGTLLSSDEAAIEAARTIIDDF
jgi:hypothetical protein